MRVSRSGFSVLAVAIILLVVMSVTQVAQTVFVTTVSRASARVGDGHEAQALAESALSETVATMGATAGSPGTPLFDAAHGGLGSDGAERTWMVPATVLVHTNAMSQDPSVAPLALIGGVDARAVRDYALSIYDDREMACSLDLMATVGSPDDSSLVRTVTRRLTFKVSQLAPRAPVSSYSVLLASATGRPENFLGSPHVNSHMTEIQRVLQDLKTKIEKEITDYEDLKTKVEEAITKLQDALSSLPPLAPASAASQLNAAITFCETFRDLLTRMVAMRRTAISGGGYTGATSTVGQYLGQRFPETGVFSVGVKGGTVDLARIDLQGRLRAVSPRVNPAQSAATSADTAQANDVRTSFNAMVAALNSNSVPTTLPIESLQQAYVKALEDLFGVLKDVASEVLDVRTAVEVETPGPGPGPAFGQFDSAHLVSPSTVFIHRANYVLDERSTTDMGTSLTTLIGRLDPGGRGVQGFILVVNPTLPLTLTNVQLSGRLTIATTGRLVVSNLSRASSSDDMVTLISNDASLEGRIEANVITEGSRLSLTSPSIQGQLILRDIFSPGQFQGTVTHDPALARTDDPSYCRAILSPWTRGFGVDRSR